MRSSVAAFLKRLGMTPKLNRLLDERLADGFNDELGHVGERRQLGNGHGDVADVFGGKNLRAMLDAWRHGAVVKNGRIDFAGHCWLLNPSRTRRANEIEPQLGKRVRETIY